MGIFDGILICTDLDGTLLRNDKSVSEENRKAIAYFKQEGGLFTFITGRMPYYAAESYEVAQPNAPFGCINGGAIYDYEGKTYVWKQAVGEELNDLLDRIYERLPQVGIVMCAFDHAVFSRDNEATKGFRERAHVPLITGDYHEIREPVGMVVLGVNTEADAMALEKLFYAYPQAEKFNLIRSEETLYLILPPGIDKGVAIEKLAQHLGIDPRKTVALGDYENDIAMFRAAGLAIAVSNACPAALAAADHVTVSNEEHAVAQVINDLAAGKFV